MVTTPHRHTQKRPANWLVIIGIILLLVIVWQLMYPRDRAVPFARLSGQQVGGKTTQQLEDILKTEYKAVPLQVAVSSDTFDTTSASVGLTPDVARTISGLKSYSMWQRFIPFSLLLTGLTRDQAIQSTVNKPVFSTYSDSLQQQCANGVQAARIQLDSDSSPLVQPAQDGRKCEASAITTAFSDVKLRKEGTKVTVQSQAIVAPGKDADSSAALKKVKTIINTKIALNVDGDVQEISKAEIAAWLTLPYDQAAKTYSVGSDESVIESFVKTAQKSIYVAPGVTRIHNTPDGAEKSREAGASGTGLDIANTAQALKDALFSGGGTVDGDVIALLPTITYDYPYSPDKAGLQALLDDLAQNKGDYGIAVRAADSNLAVSVNGDIHYRPASTYKMIVAWAILQRIDAGKMSWNDAAVNGLTASQCFDTMIINSDNPCGEYFGRDVIGWANLNKLALGLGMTCSDWNSQWYSCANDEALFLSKLESGELLNETQADRLLSAMKRQVYRLGIPSGVNWVVADKVGFLYGLLHDAAIVYAPTGTYELVIMTDNSSWAEIADAAWQIDAQLARMHQ